MFRLGSLERVHKLGLRVWARHEDRVFLYTFM